MSLSAYLFLFISVYFPSLSLFISFFPLYVLSVRLSLFLIKCPCIYLSPSFSLSLSFYRYVYIEFQYTLVWQDYCVEPPCGQLNPVNPNLYPTLGETSARAVLHFLNTDGTAKQRVFYHS